MKLVLLLLLGLMFLAPAEAQTQRVPDYFGFYLLKIPGFTWVEGATVQGTYLRLTGKLAMNNNRDPRFLSPGHAPVPLTLNQASSLILAAGTERTFDLLGVEAKAQQPGEENSSFFVPFFAEVNGQQISLIPTMNTDTPAPTQEGPKPKVGPGGMSGTFSY